MTKPDDLLTIQEAAKALHPTAVKAATVRAAIERGDLPAKRFGRTLFVLRADLEQYRLTGDSWQPPGVVIRERSCPAREAVPPVPAPSVGRNSEPSPSAQRTLELCEKLTRGEQRAGVRVSKPAG